MGEKQMQGQAQRAQKEKVRPIMLGNGMVYSKIPNDAYEGKWVKSSLFLPAPFDLVLVTNDPQEEGIPGWWSGHLWEGYQVKQNAKFSYWKINHNYFH